MSLLVDIPTGTAPSKKKKKHSLWHVMRIHGLTVDGQNAGLYRRCNEKEAQVIDRIAGKLP